MVSSRLSAVPSDFRPGIGARPAVARALQAVRDAEGYAAAEASGELDDDIRRFAALGYQSGVLTATCRSGELSSGLGESWL